MVTGLFFSLGFKKNLKFIIIIIIIIVCGCVHTNDVYMCMHVPQQMYGVRWQFCGVGFLLPSLYGFQWWTSRWQACVANTFTNEVTNEAILLAPPFGVWNRYSLWNANWPKVHYVEQSTLNCRSPCLSFVNAELTRCVPTLSPYEWLLFP